MTLNPFPEACISALSYIQKHHALHEPGQLDEFARKHLFAELWTKKLKQSHHFRANGIPWPSGPTQWSSSHSLHCWTEDKLCTWPQIIRPQMASCDGKKDPENSIGKKKKKKKSSTLKVKRSNCRWKGVYCKILITEVKTTTTTKTATNVALQISGWCI